MEPEAIVMLLPPLWLRRRWQFLAVYGIVQAVAAYLFALAIMTPWESGETLLIWLMPFLLTAAVLLLQWLFLLPIRRPAVSSTGVPILVSMAVGGLLIALLITAFVLAVGHILDAYGILDAFDVFGVGDPGLLLLGVLAGCWVISTPLLIAFSRRARRETTLQRVASGIFLGTIIEAAALIPLDALLRRREDCICHNGTFFGLVICGSVGILVFGPAVFLPLVARHRKRWYGRRCPVCGYDMRGHLTADRCPECGAGWRRPSDARES